MVLRSRENSSGAWIFMAGVILAIIIGLLTTFAIPSNKLAYYSSPIYALLVLLGIFVGFRIKVSGKDAQTFLMAGVVVVIVSRFGMESVTGSLIGIGIGEIVSSAFSALLSLFVPATIIVAIKSVFSISRV